MRGPRRARGGRGAALLVLALLAAAPLVAATEPGAVRGRATLSLAGIALADVAPVVVYLEPLDAPAPAPAARATVHQRDARFAPRFLAVAAGTAVDMPNDDAIYHNVFSFSKPNDFDLGLYPAGQSRTVTLRHPGLVKLYCSIHESMNGAIFVAPSPWFAVVGADGRFAIEGVPAGRYALATWSERLPGTRREIAVRGGGAVEVELALVEAAR